MAARVLALLLLMVMLEQGKEDSAESLTLSKGSAIRAGPFLKCQPVLGGTGEAVSLTKGS